MYARVQSSTIPASLSSALNLPERKHTGAVSDLDGAFKLAQVPEGSTITISYIGYKTVEAKAAAGMRIVMHEDNATLNELVVVGYGVQKKSVVTAP